MTKSIASLLMNGSGLWAGVARVEHLHATSGLVYVSVAGPGGREALWTRTIAHVGRVTAGDEVLVVRTSNDEAVIVGRLTDERESRLVASDGSSARLEGPDGGEVLSLHAPDGQIIAQHDTTTGVTRVVARSSRLEVSTPEGSMHLRSKGVLTMEAAQVDLHGRGGVRISAGGGAEQPSECAVLPTGLRFSGRSLHTDVQRASLKAKQTRIESDRIQLRAGETRLRTRSLQIAADRAVTRLGSVCHTVEGVARANLGRMLTFVKGAARVRAQRVDVRARENVKIDGRQIHLG